MGDNGRLAALRSVAEQTREQQKAIMAGDAARYAVATDALEEAARAVREQHGARPLSPEERAVAQVARRLNKTNRRLLDSLSRPVVELPTLVNPSVGAVALDCRV